MALRLQVVVTHIDALEVERSATLRPFVRGIGRFRDREVALGDVDVAVNDEVLQLGIKVARSEEQVARGIQDCPLYIDETDVTTKCKRVLNLVALPVELTIARLRLQLQQAALELLRLNEWLHSDGRVEKVVDESDVRWHEGSLVLVCRIGRLNQLLIIVSDA